MQDRIAEFYEKVQKETFVTLATANGTVTMRVISPVVMDDKILFFTDENSTKYAQLTANPNCCVGVGYFFAEAVAKFCGKTMLDCNQYLRKAYEEKFTGAFDENVEFGGRDAEFILLTPTRISGWAFDEKADLQIPTIPFCEDVE